MEIKMLSAQKSVKLSLVLTNIFIAVLIFLTVALPFGVSWYVEVMHRSQTLPATIMVTCYPCAPFVAVSLFSLRKILKSILNGRLFVTENSHSLRIITVCCLIIALITLIAGRFYLPFYIVGATFVFLALITFAAESVFRSAEELLSSDADSTSHE